MPALGVSLGYRALRVLWGLQAIPDFLRVTLVMPWAKTITGEQGGVQSFAGIAST